MMKQTSNIVVYAHQYKDLVGIHYQEFKMDNRTYKIGDVVGLTPEIENEPPFVCRIEKIYLPKGLVNHHVVLANTF